MEKTIAEQLAEVKAGLETLTKADIKAAIDGIETQIKAIETKADKTELEALKTSLAEIKTAADANQKVIDAFVIEKKSAKGGNIKEKTFNEILCETIERNADKIRNYKTGQDFTFDLLPELKKDNGKDVEVKVVGDMSLSANFPGADSLYSDRLSTFVETPVNRVDIAALLPSGNSSGSSVVYPKENGTGEGGVATWTTGDKALIDWDLLPVTAPWKTPAGVVIIDRFMLDDIPFLTSWIQSRMLVSLINARNTLILNGDDTAPILPGMQDVASPYNGIFTGTTTTIAIKKLIDSAYGQIPDATQDMYRGNLIILNTRDQVNLGLNTATGSGEFDLPAGSVAFSNGTLVIGGLRTVGIAAPTMPNGTFYSLDTASTMVVTRMQPELRMFDQPYARQNKIMFRIEQRLTVLFFNNAAIIKGVLFNS